MARTGRSRTRPAASATGHFRIDFGSTPGQLTPTTITHLSDSCADYVGRPISDSAFTSVQTVGGFLRITGKATGGAYSFHAFARPVTADFGVPSMLPVDPGWMLNLVAGTNPSRPVVTPPTLLQDLVELPKMLREAGRFLTNPKAYVPPAGMANVFLGVKFGWAPLIDDIQKLLDVQSYVLKREKELHQLYSGRGLRRRLQFADSNSVEDKESPCASLPGGMVAYLRYSKHTNQRQWATIHWKPVVPGHYSPNDARLHSLARQVVLGLTIEGLAKGAWDVIPWTWLIGWFTNVGKYALANSNTVPAYHTGGCLMNYASYSIKPRDVRYVGAWGTQELVPSGDYTVTKRTRVASSSVVASASLPYLDGSRLSVLGALFVQRFMR